MPNTVTVLAIFFTVLLAVLLFGGFGMMGPGMMGPGMMGPGMMGGYGFNPFRAVLSLVFMMLIIAGLTLLVIHFLRGAQSPSSESLLDILKARYARGEITKEQFDTIKRDLGV
jgi:putative membrane protein